ncbi:uncharacterized protein LOC127250645 isoform X2 [Andrographis paniculata]|uniref:uncharacterized protein LOC127250645 isoform X2 n=1 Tax=Andrographis paniculata TaxID=175694 RepID=UPI0021E9795B|nr:uncharacterized protein LOC127250645 isoform X2 [Andrographis paniculata]
MHAYIHTYTYALFPSTECAVLLSFVYLFIFLYGSSRTCKIAVLQYLLGWVTVLQLNNVEFGTASWGWSSSSSPTWCSQVVVKASSSSDESPVDANELIEDLKQKWDAVENKPTVILYGSGAIVALWFASVVVGAINSIPLVPKMMELVGLGYAGWFVYRYLLFKDLGWMDGGAVR